MEKELLAQKILESTALEIVVLDAELKVTEVNSSFCEMTGLDRTVLVGQSAACIWERSGFERLRRLLVENIAFAGELSERSAFGPSRPMHYTFSPIRDDSDTIEAFVGLGRPLMQTDRYEHEGETRYFTKVIASQMQMLDRKAEEVPVVEEETGSYE